MATLIGLTGGIACGKSMVAGLFSKLGARHIDADQVAREIVNPGTQGLGRIVEEFGEVVLGEDGTLCRERLREIVFNDPEKRIKLESITHPLIAGSIAQTIQKLLTQSDDPILIEAALLLETSASIPFDALVVVTAPPEAQLRRLEERNGIAKEDGQKILNAQSSTEEKVRRADYVIENGGSLEDTRRQVKSVYLKILAK